MHNVTKDLTIGLDADRPGALAKVFEAIAQAAINVEGYAEIGGTLHILTSDPAATRRALTSAGLRVQNEEEVVTGGVPDQPGAAGRIFRSIANANVNVTFSYVATGNRLVIGANNVAKVAEIFATAAAVTR